MKSVTQYVISSLAACLIAGATLAPADAAVRHIWINHRPAPPLRTVEVGSRTAPQTGANSVPEAACLSLNCAQDGPQAATRCLGCPAQPKGVEIVKIGL